MNRRWPTLLVLMVALGLLLVVHAAPPAAAQTVIDYGLGFVERSGRELCRNGVWYDSKAAQGHLRHKCERLAQHDQIGTGEDFSEKAATKSNQSGQPYKIR